MWSSGGFRTPSRYALPYEVFRFALPVKIRFNRSVQNGTKSASWTRIDALQRELYFPLKRQAHRS